MAAKNKIASKSHDIKNNDVANEYFKKHDNRDQIKNKKKYNQPNFQFENLQKKTCSKCCKKVYFFYFRNL